MNEIKQHCLDEFVIKEFKDEKELYEIDFVKNFTQIENFNKFSVSREHSDSLLLMAETKYAYYVVGYLKHDIEELPSWKYKD